MSKRGAYKYYLSSLRFGEKFKITVGSHRHEPLMTWFTFGGYEQAVIDVKKDVLRFGFFYYYDESGRKYFTLEDKEVLRYGS